MKNAWNYEIPRIEEIVNRSELKNLIGDVTKKMLSAVGQSAAAANGLTDFLYNQSSSRDVPSLEKVLHEKILSQGTDAKMMRDGMLERARVIYSQIQPHLKGESLADVGCGHGLVSWAAHRKFKDTLLLDVVDYRDASVKLPFVKFAENDSPPFGKKFDCSLLITVIHHASNPMKLLEDVWKQTNQRLIIIESVFGVEAGPVLSPLPNLNQSEQLCYAVYCDWFYNRVLNQGVPVPFNFNTPSNWRQIFEKLPAKISYEENLGVDLDIVPEHHFLFVLDKI